MTRPARTFPVTLRLLALAGAVLAGYLLLAGQATGTEIGTGLMLAAMLAAWSVPDLSGTGPSRNKVRHLRRWGRMLAQLPGATARTAVVLARVAVLGGSPGRAWTLPFVHGPTRDRDAAARRATAVLAASFAPDSFVVRLPPGRDQALVHAITPLPHTPDPRWLE